RELYGLADVARASLDALKIDTVEQHDQVCCFDRHAGRFGFAGGGKSERSLLQPFVEDQKSVSIPEQQLDTIPASIPKNEEMTGQGILLKHPLHKMREAVESFTQVGRFACQQNMDGGGQAQHRRASSTERTASSAWGSNPRMIRTIGPDGSAISMVEVTTFGAGPSCTT